MIGDCVARLLPGANRSVRPRAQAAHHMDHAVYVSLVRMMTGRALKPSACRAKPSLLRRYSTVGNLMGALVCGALAIEGRIERFVYTSLYHLRLIAIHGWLKGKALILIGHVHAIMRPRQKLH